MIAIFSGHVPLGRKIKTTSHFFLYKTPLGSLAFFTHPHPTCACTRTNSEAHTTLTEALNTPQLRLSRLFNVSLNGSQYYTFFWKRES